VNKVLADLEASGKFDQIFDKWFGKDTSFGGLKRGFKIEEIKEWLPTDNWLLLIGSYPHGSIGGLVTTLGMAVISIPLALPLSIALAPNLSPHCAGRSRPSSISCAACRF